MVSLTPNAPEKTMPFADKVFYLVSGAFIVVFGTGLWLIFVERELPVGIPLTGVGVIGMSASLLEKARGIQDRQRNYTITNGILAICVLLIVGYDLYNRATSKPTSFRHGDQLGALIDWGWGAGQTCFGTIDGNQIIDQQDKYRVVLICGFNDDTIDPLEDTRITVTNSFRIEPDHIPLRASLSKQFSDGLSEEITKHKGEPIILAF